MGMSFPLITKLYIDKIENVSKKIGDLYAVNTMGSIFGSIFTGFLLIPFMGITKSIALISVFVIILISILYYSVILKKHKRYIFVVLIIFNSLLIVTIPNLTEFKFQSYDETDIESISFYKEGVSATTKVYKTKNDNKKMTVNGVLMGGDFDKAMRKQKILAALPLLLKPEAKNIFVVGLGTGITLSEFIKQKKSIKIDCAEISSSVVEASRLFQTFQNDALNHPNVNVIIDDGKNFLKLNDTKYDIISSDTMLKKGSAGNSIMYSDEYYKLCNEHLTDGGIFIQWIPLYLNNDIYRIILRTALNAFEYTSLWYVGDEAMLQVSSNSPLKIDYTKFKSTFYNSSMYQSLEEIDFSTPESILSTMIIDKNSLMEIVGDGYYNSIVHPYVEFRVPRDIASFSNVSANLNFLMPNMQNILMFNGLNQDSSSTENYRISIQKSTDSFKHVIRGLIYFYQRQTKPSKTEFVKALIINPEDSNAKHYLGLSNFNPENAKKARAYLEAGILFSELKHDSLAVKMFERSLIIRPGDLKTLNYLSLSYDKLGNLEKAIELGEKMIILNQNNFLLFFNLGYFYEKAGRLEDALIMYKKSLTINPTNKSISTVIKKLEAKL